ncbi:MAG: hypothetical protein AAGM22_29150, partial [Acidobacteriota bacterium]
MRSRGRFPFIWLVVVALLGAMPSSAEPGSAEAEPGIRSPARGPIAADSIAEIRDGVLILKGGTTINLSALPTGESLVIDVIVDVDSPLPGGTTELSSQIDVAGSNFVTEPTDDPATAADDDPTITGVVVAADLQVTKTDGSASATPGAAVTYTVVASNAGPSSVTDAVLADTFPAILSGCSYSSVAAGGATGNTTSGSGNLADTLSLPSGGSVTYTATCFIDSGATGVLSNTATLASGTIMDPNTANNMATDTSTLVPSADLEVFKTNGTSTSIPGTSTTYTISVNNLGPSNVTDAVVTDTFPAVLSNCAYTSVAAGGATGNTLAGSGDIADTLNLPAKASVTYTATCDIDPTATGSLVNTATASSATATDANGGNDASTDTDTLEVTADLAITKDNGGTTSIPGGQTTYTIIASNIGPSAVTDAAVADTFPASLSNCSYTSVAAGGATGNTAAGTGDIADTLTLPVSASVTYTATCDIDPAATGSLANTATISSAIAVDGTAGNDSATDTDSLEVTADLSITKDNGTPTSIPGDQTTYTIAVANAGPSAVIDAAVADTFPGILSNCSYSSVAAGGATGNTASGTGDIADTLTLPVSASVTYTATCDIDPAATGSLTNTATVSSAIATEVDGADNSSADTDTLSPSADLAITKDNGTTSVTAGDTTTYTIVVSNNGPSTVTDAAVADTFPASLTNCSFTSVAAGGTTGNTASGTGDIADTLTLPPTASVTYTATCDVDLSAAGTVTNTATVSSVLAGDAVPANNSASDTDSVNGSTDLSLMKEAAPTVIAGGDTVTYTITVTNTGPNDATQVVVTDALPPEVTLVATSGCAEDPVGVPTCSLGDLAASASAQFTVEVTVNADPPLQIVNTASVDAENPDPNTANDADSATLSTDATPPQVVLVRTALQEIEACETLNERVQQLVVVFSEAMATSDDRAGGGGRPPEADSLENYVLVRPGDNRSFETTSCDGPSGDDFRAEFGELSYAGDTPIAPQSTVLLVVPMQQQTFFTDDLYRLFVCGTTTDVGGNPLDGDGDGTSDGTDDFSIDFRLDFRNLFANAHFDCDLGGWDIDPPGSLQVTQSAEDFEGSANSGSAQAAFATEEAFGLSQCV